MPSRASADGAGRPELAVDRIADRPARLEAKLPLPGLVGVPRHAIEQDLDLARRGLDRDLRDLELTGDAQAPAHAAFVLGERTMRLVVVAGPPQSRVVGRLLLLRRHVDEVLLHGGGHLDLRDPQRPPAGVLAGLRHVDDVDVAQLVEDHDGQQLHRQVVALGARVQLRLVGTELLHVPRGARAGGRLGEDRALRHPVAQADLVDRQLLAALACDVERGRLPDRRRLPPGLRPVRARGPGERLGHRTGQLRDREVAVGPRGVRHPRHGDAELRADDAGDRCVGGCRDLREVGGRDRQEHAGSGRSRRRGAAHLRWRDEVDLPGDHEVEPGASHEVAEVPRRELVATGRPVVAGALLAEIQPVRRVEALRLRRRLALHARRGAALLHHVGELVGDERSAGVGPGVVAARRERDRRSVGVGVGTQPERRHAGGAIAEDGHVREVVGEARLHERARRVVQRRALRRCGGRRGAVRRGRRAWGPDHARRRLPCADLAARDRSSRHGPRARARPGTPGPGVARRTAVARVRPPMGLLHG